MKYISCPLKYIGQTGRPFDTRYKEHIRDIKYNNSNSSYCSHILKTGHQYGSITDTIKVIRIQRKGKYLNTLERYHIYKVSREGVQMNDAHVDVHNSIFEALQEVNTR
jgi:hypothetical protein